MKREQFGRFCWWYTSSFPTIGCFIWISVNVSKLSFKNELHRNGLKDEPFVASRGCSFSKIFKEIFQTDFTCSSGNIEWTHYSQNTKFFASTWTQQEEGCEWVFLLSFYNSVFTTLIYLQHFLFKAQKWKMKILKMNAAPTQAVPALFFNY